MDRLRSLNAAQREAVQTLSGPLLVLAGAGTGKTRVITYRMAELVHSGVAADRILSVTFTNKAAREMLQRSAVLMGTRLRTKPFISTFHSYCVRVLRQEIERLGYPRAFAILDRGDQESAARTALRDIRVGEKSLRPGDLINSISRWKMAGVTPDRATEHIENDLDYLAAVAYRKYQNIIRASGSVDFDDLLLLTNQLFTEFPDALDRQQRRFDHVQIDEYQDTNGVQFRLIEALVERHRSLCVVGDDDQSIYGWRGADVQHILNFQAHFPGAKIVRLVDNYRSTDKILEVANRLVRHNPGRHEKSLVAHKATLSDVRFLAYEDEVTEAESVIREIAQLVHETNVSENEIAILFRTNEQPRAFEAELRRIKLPYILIGGQSFFDRREIRDTLAYTKVLARPSDETSLLRIINTPARGIGTSTVEKVLGLAVKQKCSFWEAVPQAAAAGHIAPKTVTAINSFRDLLNRYRSRMKDAPEKMEQVLRELLVEINYEAEIEKQYKESQQQLARGAILDQFVESMGDYVSRTKKPSLAEFLEETALVGRDEETDKDGQLAENAIKLMTLHSAKGLEFERVYLVGLEEGLLPHHRSIEGTAADIAEERRLAYVGVTRAMDELTITRAATRRKWGKPRTSIPSRFLFEMREQDEAVAELETSETD